MKRVIISGLSLVLLCSPVAFAQDRSAGSQFPNNYVGGIKLQQDSGNGQSNKRKKERGSYGGTKGAQAKAENFAPPNPEDGMKALEKFETTFTPVKAVGAFLWAGDWKHFDEKLNELAQASIDHDVPVSEVVVVAPPDMMVPVMMHLNLDALAGEKTEDEIRRAARVAKRWKLLPELPPEYGYIERSPTWVVHTEHGNFLLEATSKPLDKYFAGKGKFDLAPYKTIAAKHGYSGVEQ